MSVKTNPRRTATTRRRKLGTILPADRYDTRAIDLESGWGVAR